MNPVTSFLVFAFFIAALAFGYLGDRYIGVAFFAAGVLIAMSLKMANAWLFLPNSCTKTCRDTA